MSARAIKSTKAKRAERVFGKNGVFFSFPDANQEQIQIRIDFSLVAPPTSYYYADAIHLRLDEELHMSTLSFGHRNENTDQFLDRIDIVMPTRALVGQFWLGTRPVEQALDKILQMSGMTPVTRTISPPETQAVKLFANMIFAAVGESETTLDFYHLPPREVHLAKTQRKDMQLQPTVRAIMSNVLTKYFFNLIRPHAESASNSLPALDRSKRAARSR